jgi:hypothetical protein
MSNKIILVGTFLIVTLLGGWMFRYQTDRYGLTHRNRLTGAVCFVAHECWFHSDERLVSK